MVTENLSVVYSDKTVADPGFPVGGRGPRRGGGVDSRGGYDSKILYVKTKESGPLGGVRRASANVDPPMQNHHNMARLLICIQSTHSNVM